MPPFLENALFCNKQISAHYQDGQREQAIEAASRQMSIGLSDMALIQTWMGKQDIALQNLKDALALFPGNRIAFHNLATIYKVLKRLRGESLQYVQQHLDRNWNAWPWTHEYARLFCLPQYLNVNIVSGKCNLNCRMCQGTNDPKYPEKLEWMSAEDFECMLNAVPTIRSVTFSSGNSDPLMHPEYDRIVEIARNHGVMIDYFTNGHLLNERRIEFMISSQVVNMINVSIDAATAETYRRIRRADFNHVIANVEALQAAKSKAGKQMPWLSLSFVAMADNIQELPAYVHLARRLGAMRVYVEALNGWRNGQSDNRDAVENPAWRDSVAEACRMADQFGIFMRLHERLGEAAPTKKNGKPAAGTPAIQEQQPVYHYCPWVGGAVVNIDGSYSLCCQLKNVTEMGGIHDGPIYDNEPFMRVKELLLSGSVFAQCLNTGCEYVAQKRRNKQDLQVIPPEELTRAVPNSPQASLEPVSFS